MCTMLITHGNERRISTAEGIMNQQAIRSVEYDQPQAQGLTCGIGQADRKSVV